ncbi:MAG: DJ-1/PfpI family protein [Anaerolineaceae bacterium]|nr:DJ-1/PfpI family protein [Anaerolineaceae bacterium]MCB9098580.1 DJ-1/PfpI family protein [Anaerolineales bacterium]
MFQPNGYIFVLWGNHFEEATATIFVTELREAGLRVKVVGLTPQRISGSHGLALVPDLTLDQALSLAIKVICLVIPHTSSGLNRFKNDPRLRHLFSQAFENQAKFVISQLNETDLPNLNMFPGSLADQIIAYPVNKPEMVGFARELANSLLMN